MFASNISFLITLMCINIYPVRPINSFVIQYPLFNIQYISDIPQRPIWSGRYSTLILLCPTHTPEAEPISFSLFRWSKKEGRGYFLGISQKCCATEGKSAHESWPDTKKIQSSKTQHCRLCILVFPYLSRHQQYIPTPVADFGFLFFGFGENRWHPTDRRDMNRGCNSSKSWARQPPSPSPLAVLAPALPLALAAQVELDKHHVHISSPGQHQKPLKVDWDFTRSATRSDMEPPRLLFHVFKLQAFIYERLREWWNQKLCDIINFIDCWIE